MPRLRQNIFGELLTEYLRTIAEWLDAYQARAKVVYAVPQIRGCICRLEQWPEDVEPQCNDIWRKSTWFKGVIFEWIGSTRDKADEKERARFLAWREKHRI